jgi:SSS family solute:Na+ symporter
MSMTNVLELMLYSYAFMVSGLFVPILAGLYGKHPDKIAALASMIIGGTTTLTLVLFDFNRPFNLDENIFGITASFVVYFGVKLIRRFFNGQQNINRSAA